MRFRKHIPAVLSIVVLLASCGREKEEVIPRGKLAEIYAEMFLTDQWIISNPGNRQVADTSLVYEPILERYGYTSADYRKSVDVYMDDPERFSRILRTTGEILDKKLKALEKRKAEMEHEAALKKLRESMKIRVEIDRDAMNPYLFKEPYVHYYDSLSVGSDSSGIYRFINIDRSDTVYRDLRMVILDSLEVKEQQTADTLQITDTLAIKDTTSYSNGKEKNSGKIRLHSADAGPDKKRVCGI